jgi:hypothetical protein
VSATQRTAAALATAGAPTAAEAAAVATAPSVA